MNTHLEESIGLTSRSPYLDDANAQSDSHISASDTLLEDDGWKFIVNTNFQQKPKWRGLFSSRKSGRRKPSTPMSDFAEQTMAGRRKGSRLSLKIGLGILVLLGVIQLFNLIVTLITFLFPGGVHDIVQSWGRPGHIGAGLASWPTDFSRDIHPIPCHSHNDYWRTVPLFSAIEAGCIGVEADIWLFEEDLFVGHSIASLTRNRTLNSLYINPLLNILSKQNPKPTLIPQGDDQLHGVFDTNPEQSLIFLIDFKTAGDTLWPYVQATLEPLRAQNYLTRSNGSQIFPGPITVVGTGNTPFDLVNSDASNPHHDMFFDAPLDDMYETATEGISSDESVQIATSKQGEAASREHTTAADDKNLWTRVRQKRTDEAGQGKSGTSSNGPHAFNSSNSYYASVSFGSAIGQLWQGEFSEEQLERLRGQIRGAHKRGLKARYWDLPYWPISLRDHVWDVLVKEGVDLLNVDDLKGATRRNWNRHHGWWRRLKDS